MTVRFEGKVDTAAMRRVRTAIATTPQRIYPSLRREFTRWGNEWERRIQDRFTGSTGASSLHGRTGNLQKSLRASVSGSSIGDLSLRCVSAGPNYARIQEYGGEIKPKNAKKLTIPILGNLSAAGVPRYPTVGSLFAAFGDKRVAFVARAGKNTLVMLKGASIATTGKAGLQKRLNKNTKGSSVPMFVLVDKVTIPAGRLGFFAEWQKLGNDRRAGLGRLARQLGRAV